MSIPVFLSWFDNVFYCSNRAEVTFSFYILRVLDTAEGVYFAGGGTGGGGAVGFGSWR